MYYPEREKQGELFMSEASNASSQQATEINALNGKLSYDFAAQLQGQALIDNQVNARARADLAVRAAEDAQTLKFLTTVGLMQITQTGATENQAAVDPVRSGTGDALVGSVGVSADTVAAAQANLLSTMTPIIASAVAAATSEALAAFLPVLVTAIGGASTPSQTQAKPTSAA